MPASAREPGRSWRPCESTIGRTIGACDGDELDAVLGAWIAEQLTRAGEELVVTVDGKSVRGARGANGRCPHLLAAILGQQRAVLAQREVDHKTNEITQFQHRARLRACAPARSAPHRTDMDGGRRRPVHVLCEIADMDRSPHTQEATCSRLRLS